MKPNHFITRIPAIAALTLICTLVVAFLPTGVSHAAATPCPFGEEHPISLDGVDLSICVPFTPDMVIPAGEDEIVQSGSLLAMEPYQQLLIYPVAYGLVPAASDLPVSEEGASFFYKEKTISMMFSEGENIIDIPAMDIFGEEVKPFAAITPAAGPEGNQERLNVVWILEKGERIWTIQYNEIGDFSSDEEIAGINEKIEQIQISGTNLDNPSTALELFDSGAATGGVFEVGADAARLADLPLPSWWSGDCNVNKHPGSYPLGSSFRGVKACGPRGTEVWVNFGAGSPQLEWQCPEITKRYLYLAYGIPPFSANGKDVVNNCPANSQLEKVANGTANKAPLAGDVLSYNGPSIYGHTSLVSSSNVDSNGNGTITIIEQNYTTTGTRTHAVSKWYVQSSDGVTGWLHQKAVTPAKAVLVSPAGNTTSSTPTYTWKAISNASKYYLWLEGPAGKVLDLYYTPAEAGCSSGSGTCSVKPSFTLWNTGFTWFIQASNSYGDGEWSEGMAFTKSTGTPPPVPTLVSPEGSGSAATPTFTWNASAGAMWYYLRVEGPGGTVLDNWYTATQAGCSSATCSVTPQNKLDSADYQWRVLGFNNFGISEWSPEKSFKVEGSTLGFDSQFNANASGWTSHTGTWKIESSQYYAAQSPASTRASISYIDSFSDFDYQVRMKREGCNSCANTLFVRGTPQPLWDQNRWNNGLLFQYTRNGNFSVWKYQAGKLITLQNWTSSPSINTLDAWNTVRVVGNGSKFNLYMNGTLVWVSSDTSFSSGKVGIGTYSSGAANDRLLVDWATLTSGSGGQEADQVSEEQQELNEAAMQEENSCTDNEDCN